MPGENTRTFAVMAKVVGGRCNLRCTYCYYTEKPTLLSQGYPRMPEDVLEAYVQQNFAINGKDATVEFAWHGGEPTLGGIDFFQRALELEKKYGQGRTVVNTLQTNATLLTDEWCDFFKKNGFLLGVSVDGPRELHDIYRVGPEGGSFARVLRSMELLRKHEVPFNTLATVNRGNEKYPGEVYDFLREYTDYMQFLPVVETQATLFEAEDGQHFAMPPGIKSTFLRHPVTDFSVTPEGYGNFLCGVFDRWSEMDRGKKFVRIFEVTAGNMQGRPSSLCVHNPLCGHAASVEVNGDVYPCERYVFQRYRLGNIVETPLEELMEKNRRFGMHKTYGLPKECFSCPYIKLCFGGCPKDRIVPADMGEGRKNYLCPGYRIFFGHFLKNL
ncbi:MAG TPA: anaerobic sulfatase maturase [Synergistaceae bacterium]|nr:anaerobic sulfatase maturase [Synergistaceae bacterium]